MTNYEDDDRILNRIMAAAAPTTVCARLKEISGPDAEGQFFAAVIQISATGSGPVERQILVSQSFGTRRSAERWLNRQ